MLVVLMLRQHSVLLTMCEQLPKSDASFSWSLAGDYVMVDAAYLSKKGSPGIRLPQVEGLVASRRHVLA